MYKAGPLSTVGSRTAFITNLLARSSYERESPQRQLQVVFDARQNGRRARLPSWVISAPMNQSGCSGTAYTHLSAAWGVPTTWYQSCWSTLASVSVPSLAEPLGGAYLL